MGAEKETGMKRTILLAAVLGLLAGAPAVAAEQQVWTARYPLPPGGSLAVENVQGNIWMATLPSGTWKAAWTPAA